MFPTFLHAACLATQLGQVVYIVDIGAGLGSGHVLRIKIGDTEQNMKYLTLTFQIGDPQLSLGCLSESVDAK